MGFMLMTLAWIVTFIAWAITRSEAKRLHERNKRLEGMLDEAIGYAERYRDAFIVSEAYAEYRKHGGKWS